MQQELFLLYYRMGWDNLRSSPVHILDLLLTKMLPEVSEPGLPYSMRYWPPYSFSVFFTPSHQHREDRDGLDTE